VPWAAKSFRLLAGTCHIAAGDAEFGVAVTSQNVEIHAFSGEVSVERFPFGGPSASAARSEETDDPDAIRGYEPVVIPENKGLIFSSDKDGTSPPVSCPADRNRFATNLSMAG